MKATKIAPEKVMNILLDGGYLERRDERTSAKKCPKLTTRLYDRNGNDLGVANYARRRLEALCRIKEIKGGKYQRWVVNQGRQGMIVSLKSYP